MHMSHKNKASTGFKSIGAAGLAAATIISGLSFGSAAVAAPSEGSPATDQVQPRLIYAYAPTGTGVTATADSIDVYGTPNCGGDVAFCTLNAIGDSSQSNVIRDGAWPSWWLPGETHTVSFQTMATERGTSFTVYSIPTGLISVTRPQKISAITARVVSQDDDARSAVVSGTATPNARVTRGTQSAYASSTGAWTMTVGNLQPGKQTLTFTQVVDNVAQGTASVDVTIGDPTPVNPAAIVGQTGTSTPLERGADTAVEAVFKTSGSVSRPQGTV